MSRLRLLFTFSQQLAFKDRDALDLVPKKCDRLQCWLCRKQYDNGLHQPVHAPCCNALICRKCVERAVAGPAGSGSSVKATRRRLSCWSCHQQWSGMDPNTFRLDDVVLEFAVEIAAVKPRCGKAIDSKFCLPKFGARLIIAGVSIRLFLGPDCCTVRSASLLKKDWRRARAPPCRPAPISRFVNTTRLCTSIEAMLLPV